MDTTQAQLFIPPHVLRPFRDALVAARTGAEEVIGFLFCRRCPMTGHRERWIPQHWVVPERDCYEVQSPGGLVLDQAFHRYLLKEYLGAGYGMVHVHTHPTEGPPRFSSTDDTHEAEYARFLGGRVGKPPFLSGVYDLHLRQGQFRLWSAANGGPGASPASVSYAWEDGARPGAPFLGTPQTPLAAFDRQRVFGEGFQATLANLRIALVGCGGIGAPFAEQMSRLGVRNWVLVDPDRVDTPNLNRMPFATPATAEQCLSKTRYVKHLIKRMWPRDARVCCLPQRVETAAVRREVGSADLVVVTTDNHYSRLVSQEIALEYGRPLVSLASHIDLRGEGERPRMFSRITIPPLRGGWCLVCNEIIDARQAALEQSATAIRGLAQAAGYIDGVAAPAVYWLNNTTASLGAAAIHQALVHSIDWEPGLDWIVNCHEQSWRAMEHETHANCLYCGRSAASDSPPEESFSLMPDTDGSAPIPPPAGWQ